MRKLIKVFLKKIYLDGVARELMNSKRGISWQFKRKFGHVDREIIDSYFAANAIRKLHIGCGNNILDTWLNTDLFPLSPNILHIDATESFPLRDGSFDFVFSEHMIEHISYPQGLFMMSECYRILKAEGKIRISTPNLEFLIDLYKADKPDLQKDYIKWATDRFIHYAPSANDTFVINNFVRDWGHQFIYDEKTLHSAMETVGFTNIIRVELNKSEVETLRDLEHENRMPESFLRLETFTLEGTKLPA